MSEQRRGTIGRPSTAEVTGEYDEETGEVRPAAPLAQRAPEPAPLARPAPTQQAPQPAASRVVSSANVDRLMAALCAAQAKYSAVVKTRQADLGARGKYAYANLSDVAAAVMPALAEAGVFVLQIPSGNVLVTRLSHGESGQWLEGTIQIVQPQEGRGGIQALGSALTYLRRYMLTSMLGIVPADVEDDDGMAAQRASAPVAPVRQPQRPAAPPMRQPGEEG